jgi:hypothetical protein
LARFARSGYGKRVGMELGKIKLIWDVIQNAPFNGYHRFGIRAPDTYFIRWNPDDEGVVAPDYTAADYHIKPQMTNSAVTVIKLSKY